MQPLGMENRLIKDSQISASSVFTRLPHRDARQARLNNNYAWCSDTVTQQWVRVDLTRRMSITGISVQGDPEYPILYFAEFKLRYSVDGKKYMYYIGTRGYPKVCFLYAFRFW